MDNQLFNSELKDYLNKDVIKELAFATCPHCNLPLILIRHKITADINCPYCNEIIKFDDSVFDNPVDNGSVIYLFPRTAMGE